MANYGQLWLTIVNNVNYGELWLAMVNYTYLVSYG